MSSKVSVRGVDWKRTNCLVSPKDMSNWRLVGTPSSNVFELRVLWDWCVRVLWARERQFSRFAWPLIFYWKWILSVGYLKAYISTAVKTLFFKANINGWIHYWILAYYVTVCATCDSAFYKLFIELCPWNIRQFQFNFNGKILFPHRQYGEINVLVVWRQYPNGKGVKGINSFVFLVLLYLFICIRKLLK